MMGLFDKQKKARKAFANGLDALVRGDFENVEPMMQGLQAATELDVATDRAQVLADFTLACAPHRGKLNEIAQDVLEQVVRAAASNCAVALYTDYAAGEALFAQSLGHGDYRTALDSVLGSEGGDYSDFLCAGWLTMMRMHLEQGDVEMGAEAIQGAASSYVRARGPDSADAVQALERAQVVFTDFGRFDVAVQIGERALEMLERATYDHKAWQHLGVLTNTALFCAQTQDTDRAKRFIDAAVELGEVLKHDMATWGDDIDTMHRDAAAALLSQLPEMAAAIASGGIGAPAEDDDDDGLMTIAMFIPNADATPTLYVTRGEDGEIQWAGIAQPGQTLSIKCASAPIEVWTQALNDSEIEQLTLGALDAENAASLFDASRAQKEDLGA